MKLKYKTDNVVFIQLGCVFTDLVVLGLRVKIGGSLQSVSY